MTKLTGKIIISACDKYVERNIRKQSKKTGISKARLAQQAIKNGTQPDGTISFN